jgi:uncharacterized protein (TIGR02757 family)
MGKRLTPRERAVRGALDAVRAECNIAERRAADPVAFAHRYTRTEDQELVALVAASVAFGNVTTIRAKVEDLLGRLGPSPARAADDTARLHRSLRTWKHRVFVGRDLACLLAGARAIQRAHGSLGALFELELARSGDLREALARWCDALRDAGGLNAAPASGGGRRGPAHLVPDVRAGSGVKRLLLFLRWMVRGPDGIDLGLWSVDPSFLLVPVDVHIHKLSRNLGLTRRPSPSWATTVEITRALARFDPRDPVKYDFSLCHFGMLRRCPSRADTTRCEGCPVRPVCVHWVGPDSGTLRGALDDRPPRA